MSHGHSFRRTLTRTREAAPAMRPVQGGAQILCPFCAPTHPLIPGQPSPCGTVLRLTAVQTIIPARVVKANKLVCIKCRKSTGEMVQYMSSYVHLEDCNPGTNLLRVHPQYSFMARLVFRMPVSIRKPIEKLTGRAQEVKELSHEGKETGRVMGYFFLKQKVANG